MYQIEYHINIIVLSFQQNLITESQDVSLLADLENAIEQNYKLCMVDIAKVQFLNSNGLNLLIRILTLFRNNGGEMILMNPSESVNKLLIITKLKAIFQIVSSYAEGKKILNASK
ncbi:MAG: anti-sigma factor antagonist [Bacteroidetes bacterium]|nr:MAG: anti-sigma factor antagonist [Bacteroidota bacterium]